ncbi:class I SAM-dependent methyltransferase [Nocardioides mesophilus]|uniref:Methyltransferase domain-containing protein n=1 Tax=Nocardioides mesophilus TaxID=433659 RepID=A0A7G9R7N3_9ACTN|nr:class I SAM-dependent methyltransferase [Nocardioides mesophilus]QNN51608.1 methyltransferase domain-containing protein [Nocardioides mesophilus]
MSEQTQQVGALFDRLADDYDQSGVAFFEPIAEQLVAALDVRPGERALDVGCGRGAVTLLLARAVGTDGSVTAVDLAPAMVEHTRVAAAGLGNVRAAVMDATAPTDPPAAEGSFDLLASSLVLFFLPDPGAALAGWVRLLRPGGRIGVTTFGDQDDTWRAVDALFEPYLPPHLLDPRTRGRGGPFTSDAGMEELMRSAGASEVRTVHERLPVRFADAEQWRRFSMGTGQRAMWGFVPEAEREVVFARAADLLAGARDGSGAIVLHQDVRHTLGRRPAG